jgi:hypothetical protein
MEEETKTENPEAFACVSGPSTEEGSFLQRGMSLRDYFTAKNVAAMVSTIRSDEDYQRAKRIAKDHGFDAISDWIAYDSGKQADASLKERMKN